jgi:precorrin-2 dehydrogenase/sirohydrochlorin ferrochelatase
MANYPIYINLSGRRVVVIGGGSVAARKAQVLLEAGARLVIVSDKFDEAFEEMCKGLDVELVKSKYSKEYLGRAVLVVAATNDMPLNREIYSNCQELEILCNVVDQPDLCDFYVPAIVRRGNLQIAISTEGDCPAYAGHLRRKLEDEFTEDHGSFLEQLKLMREYVIENVPSGADRKSLLGQLVKDESFEFFLENGADEWAKRARKIVENEKS